MNCNISLDPMSQVRHGVKAASKSVLHADGMHLRLELVGISRHAIAGKTGFHTAVEDWQLQRKAPPAAPALSEIPAQLHDDPEETTYPVCCW